jgi:nitrite reductase (NADH) small subunit
VAHLLGPISQIPPGEGRNFIVAGSEIAVFHTRDGGVFAIGARCPHRGGPLADGLTDSETVMCPLHERIFSLRTGEGIGHACSVLAYGVRLLAGTIELDVRGDLGREG